MQSLTQLIGSRGYTVLDEGMLRGQMSGSDTSVMRNFITEAAKEENPLDLPQKYEATKKWIEESTPELKRELYRILYAFFFHSAVIMAEANVDLHILKSFVENHFHEHHKYHKQDLGKITKLLKHQISPSLKETTWGLKITQISMNALVSFLSKNGYCNLDIS